MKSSSSSKDRSSSSSLFLLLLLPLLLISHTQAILLNGVFITKHPVSSRGTSKPPSTPSFVPSFTSIRRRITTTRYASSSSSFSSQEEDQYGLGYDFGTSGVRITVLQAQTKERIYEAAQPWPHFTAVKEGKEWCEALFGLMGQIPEEVRRKISRIAVSGTSASCLMVDRETGDITRPARLYNWDAVRESSLGSKAQELLREYAPPRHTTLSGTSTLMKVLAWHLEDSFTIKGGEAEEVMLHQADYLAGQLMHSTTSEEEGKSSSFPRVSDWNNMLKLGFDMADLRYPVWFTALGEEIGLDFNQILPTKVVQPGQPMGPVSSSRIKQYGLHASCTVVGGTTDSIAAFLASGAFSPGQAVSSLGSTLAIKLLSHQPVEDASRGVYSHRLGDLWLVGGASNVGCAVLREQRYSDDELEILSRGIDPLVDVPYDYYPLAGDGGERFPSCDSQKKAILTPKPPNDDRRTYLHAILQGIARVEKEGYDILKELGADPPVQEVLTAGGGAKNPMWIKMRQRILQVPTKKALETDAAYGAALLALTTLDK